MGMEYKRFCGLNFNSGFQISTDPIWHPNTVTRILKNEVYLGIAVQGKNRKINYKVKESRPIDPAILLAHAFAHGIYGTDKSYKAGRIAVLGKDIKSGKIKSLVAAVFLPYKRMKTHFPIQEKWPVLLPYCWLKRIIRYLKGNVKTWIRMMNYSDVNEADYMEMKRFFEAGGISTSKRSWTR